MSIKEEESHGGRVDEYVSLDVDSKSRDPPPLNNKVSADPTDKRPQLSNISEHESS